MDRARINDVDLAFDTRGDGEPVLLIHGAFVADGLLPLATQPALEGFRIIRYHRRGYGDSQGEPTPSVVSHAEDARALLGHLDAVPAHIIGHSFGGAVALQLAADNPDAVRSLTLLEPAIMQIPSGQAVGEALGKITQPAQEGDFDKAGANFLRTVMGREYRQYIEYNVGPNALAQAFADADDALAGDIQGLGSWEFGADDAARIKCPAMFVLGGNSEATMREAFGEFGVDTTGANAFSEMIDVGRSWLPDSEIATLGELSHALQMQDAWAVGVALAPFMAKHRTRVPA